MKRRLLTALAVLVCIFGQASVLAGESSFLPVVTGRGEDSVFTTTVELRNPLSEDVLCVFTYRAHDRSPAQVFTSDALIPARATRIYEDFLGEVQAFGLVSLECPAEIRAYARIQQSLDGGRTFTEGRLYQSLDATAHASPSRSRTFTPTTDLVAGEISGNPVAFHVTARNKGGAVLGAQTFTLPPFGHRVVNLQTVFAITPEPVVEIAITSTTGKVAVGRDLRGGESEAVAVRSARNQPEDSPVAAEISELALSRAIASLIPTASFKAAPFQEPLTGHVYMRDRWYEPSTGSFLTPDPEGYQDSANPYAFCGGDPVNCSDPTGRAASMSQNGWIIATDNRNGGVTRRFSPAEIARDPVGVRRFLGLNADVEPREADALMARAGQISVFGNVHGIDAVRRGTQMAEPIVTATGTSLVVMSGLTGVGGAAQLTQALIDDGTTKTNVTIAGLTLLGLGGADDLIRIGTNQAKDIAALRQAGGALGLTGLATQQVLPTTRIVRHHLFNKFRGTSPGSQKYRDFFSRHGIHVDQYSVEIPEAMHRRLIHGAGRNWTTRWKEWIDANPDAVQQRSISSPDV